MDGEGRDGEEEMDGGREGRGKGGRGGIEGRGGDGWMERGERRERRRWMDGEGREKGEEEMDG